MSTELCTHGVSDDCVLMERAVNTDFRHGTRVVIDTHWCPVHKSMIVASHKELFAPTVSWEKLGV